MTKIEWEDYRRPDGTIDLRRAARQTGVFISERGMRYLEAIETMQPIQSRQAAAVALAAAYHVSHEL